MNNSFIELISRVDTVKVESVNLKPSQYKLSKLKLKEKWKEKKKRNRVSKIHGIISNSLIQCYQSTNRNGVDFSFLEGHKIISDI